jgi:alkylated DNA repair dioxygenase AlkB
MPVLDGSELLIDEKYKIVLGFIDKEEHPVLRDFDSLWDSVDDDNNLIQGKNYHNHIATWYGHVDYAYTGVRHEAKQMPFLFQNIARDIEDQLMFPNNYFNSLLVNLYTNKGIAPHSDDEPIFMNNDKTIGAVATVSLGGTAVATIARNDRSKHFTIKLTDGSCYLMPEGNFQNEYKHSVSKPDPANSQRISLTFRHIP